MGCLSNAENVFRVMVVREVSTWNAMVSSLASHGRENEALDMFKRMKLHGLKPNSITFVVVLTTYARGNLIREGLDLFRSMWYDFGIKQNLEHYGCVIDLLGKAGHNEEATEIIRNMPFQPDASVLGAFLGAMRSDCLVQFSILNPFSEPHELRISSCVLHPRVWSHA